MVEDAAVHILRNRNFPSHGTGVSLDPEYLVTGGNSGWQSLNVAVLAGAKTIILLGFDAREPAAWAKSHWHDGHPRATAHGAYAEYRKSAKAGAAAIKAAGVRVINCSPGSAIDAFERGELADCL